MKCNLSLYILKYMIRWSAGERGKKFKLSEYRKENNIPYSTFNRHVKSLMRQGMIVKCARDSYRLSDDMFGIRELI